MSDPELTAALRQLDVTLTELQLAVRRVAAALEPAPALGGTIVPANKGNGVDADADFAPEQLLDVSSASARFTQAPDTLRLWARQTAGTEVAVAIRRGGRWQFSVRALRRRLDGG